MVSKPPKRCRGSRATGTASTGNSIQAKNKYNVRAIRSELDIFIRHSSWKKFRARFQGLDPELQAAIVEHRPTGGVGIGGSVRSHKKKHGQSLLHSLCHCVHANPPVPIDLLESVIQASPQLLSGSHPNSITPLSIALDKQASPGLIEALLMHDTTRRSLYQTDGKGDTPILQAIKNSSNDSILNLLMEYDTTKESLLIPSKKRQKIPLFYVVHQELAFVNLEDGTDELPGEVEYMLLQTYQALQFQQTTLNLLQNMESPDSQDDSWNPRASGAASAEQVNTATTDTITQGEAKDYDEYDSNDDEYLYKEEYSIHDVEDEHWTPLLHATISCAHFLGDKYATTLTSFLLDRIPNLESATDDSSGNTILHYFCKATHNFAHSSCMAGRDFLDRLVEAHPEALIAFNHQGRLPLHLALENQKGWSFLLQPLLDAAPETIKIPTQGDGLLPLHIGITSYPPDVWSGILRLLWNLYPEAATIPTQCQTFYPFQLAALPRTDGHSPEDYKKGRNSGLPTSINTSNTEVPADKKTKPDRMQLELNQLSSIFFLLRASPQVLKDQN